MNNTKKTILFSHFDSIEQRELLEKVLYQVDCDIITVNDCASYFAEHPNFIPNLIMLNISDHQHIKLSNLLELKKNDSLLNVPILAIVDNQNIISNKSFLSNIDAYIVKPIKDSDIPRIEKLINKNTSTELEDESIFNQKFKIITKLGKGGNGTVYKALNLDDNSIVSLKIIKPSQTFKYNYLHDFQREVFSFKQLNHKHIVKLFDFGYAGHLCYIATEYIKGKSLKEIVQEKPLEETNTLQLALKLTETISYIHSQHMIYRDLKPENIIITKNEDPVFIDLGLAEKEHVIALSDTSEIDGTPEYLSPEYIDGKYITIKSDIYALGITLFYTLTGKYPFQGNSPMAILAKHLYEPAPAVNSIKPDISDFFSDLISKMLIKDPDKRISLEELLETLTKQIKL